MRYYKRTADGHIDAVGKGNGGTEIAETEYNEILSVIRNKPQGTETMDYLLKENLTWEPYAIEPVDPDIDDAELLDILMGGAE